MPGPTWATVPEPLMTPDCVSAPELFSISVSVMLVRAIVPLIVPVPEPVMTTLLLAPIEAIFSAVVAIVAPRLRVSWVLAPTVKLDVPAPRVAPAPQNASVAGSAAAVKVTLPVGLMTAPPL